MKSILVSVTEDEGQESRIDAALALARAFGSHITCLHATPYSAFVTADPFGGAYAVAEIMEALNDKAAATRARLDVRMDGEDVSWSWTDYSGAIASAVTEQSQLADLIVLSRPGTGHADSKDVLSLVGEVVVHARSPVLAVPREGRGVDCSGPVAVAWNGSPEASHALRASLPMLKSASAIHLLTIREPGLHDRFAATDAREYLGYHGLRAEMHELRLADRTIAETISEKAREVGATCLVMGGYGHSRFREAVLGGTTREMLQMTGPALLLGH